MRLCSKRRALAWSQVRLADTGGGKRRMTSVFPSCCISHDISCTEEHFIASHKHLSPVLSLLRPTLFHFTRVFFASQTQLWSHKRHGDMWWPLWLLATDVMNGHRDRGASLPWGFTALLSIILAFWQTWAGITFMIMAESEVKSRRGGGESRLHSAYFMAKQAIPAPVFGALLVCGLNWTQKHLKQLEPLNNARVSPFSSSVYACSVAESLRLLQIKRMTT